MASRKNTQHYSRHGRSVSGDNPPRMKPLIEGQNVDEEGAPETEYLRGTGRMKKMTRRYSLNEEKLRCMRVRQTSFEVISDDEMPQLGRVRTRRWSTSWRIPMGESQRRPLKSFAFVIFFHQRKSQGTYLLIMKSVSDTARLVLKVCTESIKLLTKFTIISTKTETSPSVQKVFLFWR